MKLKDCPSTYICQFSKSVANEELMRYKERRDSSTEELVRYYSFVINTLKHTPAWNVSGVNKMVNDLTDRVRAKLNGANRKGTTTAFAHAGKILYIIETFGEKDSSSTPRYRGHYKLKPIITEEEINDLLASLEK